MLKLLPSLAAASVALLAGLLSTPAHAKQCVFNKGGYVLHVHWFRVQDLVVTRDPRDISRVSTLRARAAPVQAAALTAGFGDCTKIDELLVAVFSVPGMLGFRPQNEPQPFNLLGATALPIIVAGTRLANHLGGGDVPNNRILPEIEIQCMPGLQGYCRGTDLAAAHRPAGEHVILVTQPSPLKYLDFFGTAFDVSWGEGGPIQR